MNFQCVKENLIQDNIDLNKIKLVIWDLDDTFWKGTLAEECQIELIQSNINLIEDLTNNGIMNSICSKNDYDNVKMFFEHNNLIETWNNFVFSSISWESKGERIKNIIQNMQLRDENVLFIDDNVSNLNEAKYVCKNIKIMLPDNINNIINQVRLLSKDDNKHSRLKQYKMLEVKFENKKKFSSNLDFLYSSNIKAFIKTDCLTQIDRITELVNRTNQLNYTKIRSTKEELIELINNKHYQNSYIEVKDNYGEYGIVGFYSLNKDTNELKHFLFSCRTIGMGVEQYVYSQLNFPTLNVVGEVINSVEPDKYINWINNSDSNINKNDNLKSNIIILFKGPCDLQTALPYLSINSKNIIEEFSSIDNEKLTTAPAMLLSNIANSLRLTKEEQEKILSDAPFLTKEVFKQTVFNKEYDFILFSLLPDTTSVLYKHKETGIVISLPAIIKPFADDILPFTDLENVDYYINEKPYGFSFDKNNMEEFIKKWEYLGSINSEQIIKNLKFVIEHTSNKTNWIFTIGSNLKPQENLFENSKMTKYRFNRYCLVKEDLINFIKTVPNATYIDLAKIIETKENYTDDVNHYTRETAFKLANEIVNTISKSNKNKNKVIKSKSKLFYYLREIKKKHLSRFTRFIYNISYNTSNSGTVLSKHLTILGIKFKIKSY